MQPTFLSLFCGIGGGALGFKAAGWDCVGAVDNDPAACRDYEYLTGWPATVADLSTMTPAELRDACGGRRPDVVFTSPPCKSFSACLPLAKAGSKHYTGMSSLATRGIWLALEAWADSPPPLLVMENVPRIMSRGRRWLDQIQGLLWGYGYACRETTHDAGELGGLAQHRRRFLLVARHMQQVPEFLYEPPKRRVRGVGEVLEQLPVPLPGSTSGGPMHRLPRMSQLNWLRLALIPAGGDWRDLPEAVGLLHRDARQNGGYGVNEWQRGSHTIVGRMDVHATWASTADPRLDCEPRLGVLGVLGDGDASGTITGAAQKDNGAHSYADPRVTCKRREGSLGVKGWRDPSTTVIGAQRCHNHPSQVADPRLAHEPRRGSFGVSGWATPTHCIRGVQKPQNGQDAVADPRELPAVEGPPLDLDSNRPCYLTIRAADGTWHRPLTTSELAALQGFPVEVRGEPLVLGGRSHKSWRQRIGNAVPPPAAEAIARECAKTLEASRDGRLLLSGGNVWVDPPRLSSSVFNRCYCNTIHVNEVPT